MSPQKPPAEAPEEKARDDGPHPLVALVNQATTSKEGSTGGGSNLVVYLIVVGIAVLGFAIMGWLLVRAKRKAAALAYELRKKEEEQKRAAEEHKLAQNNVERDAAHKKVHKLEGEIQGLKKGLEAQRELTAKRAQAVADATSWEDLGL